MPCCAFRNADFFFLFILHYVFAIFFPPLCLLFFLFTSGMRFLHRVSSVQEQNLKKRLHVKATQRERERKKENPVYLSNRDSWNAVKKPGLVMHFLMCCTDAARALVRPPDGEGLTKHETQCVQMLTCMCVQCVCMRLWTRNREKGGGCVYPRMCVFVSESDG